MKKIEKRFILFAIDYSIVTASVQERHRPTYTNPLPRGSRWSNRTHASAVAELVWRCGAAGRILRAVAGSIMDLTFKVSKHLLNTSSWV